MFSFNSGQRLPKLSEVHHFWSFDPKGKLVIEFLSSLKKITPSLDDTSIENIQLPPSGPVENINPDYAPADRFMDGNNDRLLDFSFPQLNDLYGRKESKGLPPDFVGNFCLNRIFTEPWEDADLTHALTGLDYLTNLECTRRTALREAAQRLRINEDNWQSVLADNKEAMDWVRGIQKQENEIDVCYSSLWIDLRVWTMAKELLSEPFYKPNVIAMLNTLFPPVIKGLPSLRITEKALHQHRNCFYRHIVFIEENGKSELDNFAKRINRPGTDHTWSDVRQALKDYIKLADAMIKAASQVHGISFFKNLPGEHPALRSTIVSGTESSDSDPSSFSSKSRKPSHGELRRVSTKSGGKEPEDTGSLRSSVVSKDSPGSQDSKYILPSRSRLSEKHTGQRISSQDDIDRLFQESLPPPWYSSPRRPSSASGHSLETSHSGGRLHSSSFSRPLTPSIRSLTPSIEQQRVHRRSISANKRISYDFHNALPGTPELPSPQSNEKNSAWENPGASQATAPPERDVFTEEQNQPEAPAARNKKPGFNMFRRTKKPGISLGPKPTIRVLRDKGSLVDVSLSPEESEDVTRQPADEFFVPEQNQLKKKSSFRFLRRRKSHEDCRAVSDSNSDRTITENKVQKVKPKRSLTNLFANKGAMTTGLGIDTVVNSGNAANTTETASGFRHSLRKARSYSSVRSSSSTYSNDGAQRASTSGTSTIIDEDRVITSADIDEPFPFGTFVLPQTPATLVENRRERKDIEGIRKAVLETARQERIAKWEQSEESKRKLEASQQKRRVLREEMDANSQAIKTARQKQREKDEKKSAKQVLVKATPKTPYPGVQSFERPPKTPMKERVLKLIADSYSPTSPVLD